MQGSSEAGLTAEATPGGHGVFGRFVAWAERVNLERKLAIALMLGAVAAGTVTFAAMTGHFPSVVDPWAVLLLLNLDLVLLLSLSAMIARRLVILWAEHRKGLAGARLHVRLAALFSLVAVTPTIVIATFSVLLFNFGLQGWFSDRVSTAVKESFAVAQAYLDEHRQTISFDALAMAQELNHQGVSLALNPQQFNDVLNKQIGVRSLAEAVVFDSQGRVIGRAGYSLLLEFDPQIPDWALQRARAGEVVILTAEADNRVRALLRLDGFSNAYLYVGRLVDPRVLAHIDQTENAVKLYEELEGKRSDLQLTFALIFVVVALMLLLAAIWVGLAFANHLSRPIGLVVDAAQKVGGGNLSARVETQGTADEVGILARAFNRMTSQLESQHRDLLEANEQLDHRSRFIEAVLGGVSAGVIGLDDHGMITLPNRSACDLLAMADEDLRGRKLADVVPEMADLLDEAKRRPQRLSEQTIGLAQSDGTLRRLLVRIAVEVDRRKIIGFVVTFDDITELLSAQRKAAWADVARRIAHEIKNPLTPIQLSAERLKSKYLDQITSDRETFETCTDIIVRQVGDIGRMVDEFSAFARLPAPVIAPEDLGEMIEQAMFLPGGAHPEVEFAFEAPAKRVVLPCDREQIGRALTNLIQNAIDAIERRTPSGTEPLAPGRVTVNLIDDGTLQAIVVEDNGPGLPRAERHRLTEPYVTTRPEGTGLGLAIVKKIMEDHGGTLRLEDSPTGGARVCLVFPLPEDRSDTVANLETAANKDAAANTGSGMKRKMRAHGA